MRRCVRFAVTMPVQAQVRASRRRLAGRLGAALLSVAVVFAASVGVLPTPQPAAAAPRPNILLITTDDMTKADLRWMPNTRRLLRNAGVAVGDFISNHPLCCPARAEILTGQYGHNNGVRDNQGPSGGYQALQQRGNHVGAWLRATGYRTALVGKHLNYWERTAEHQPGWTVLDTIMRNVYRPKNLTLFNNGRPRRFRDVYTADLIGGRTVRYIKRFSASKAPFFIWTSHVAPHNSYLDGRWRPPVPAPRHRGLYPNAMPPSLSSPAFNEADVRDKPPYVRRATKVSRLKMITLHRARIRSLRAVDEQVRATVSALRATGELRNTYVFFTSDNGYLMGEHRLRGKNVPYEPALRVPLLVRGPGLRAGTVRTATYGLVDLAPTFVALAKATPGRRLDGRSIMPTLRTGARGYGHYLIQGGNDGGGWWWRGVRSNRYVYVRYTGGFEELYDRAEDPAELRNVAHRPAYARVRSDLAVRLSALEQCSGNSCRTGGGAGP